MGHNIIFSDSLFGATYNYYIIIPIWIYDVDLYGKDEYYYPSISFFFIMFRVNKIISKALLQYRYRIVAS